MAVQNVVSNVKSIATIDLLMVELVEHVTPLFNEDESLVINSIHNHGRSCGFDNFID